MDILFDTIGIIGVALILVAYYLVTHGRVQADQLSFHGMNFLGAILIFVSLMHTPNIPSIILEICWIIISLMGMRKALKARKEL